MAQNATFSSGAPIEPLLYVLPEQDRVVIERRTEWVLRVVNVERALASRGYPRDARAELHLEVSDPLVSANAGRFVIEVEKGEARVRRGGRGAMQVDALGLASLYTGYLGAHELRLVGALDADEATTREAAVLFAGAYPWCPDKF
jgi:predicted acetyltransferase